MAYISKEESAAMRKQLKKQFPDLKFSLRIRNRSTVECILLSGPWAFNDLAEAYYTKSWHRHSDSDTPWITAPLPRALDDGYLQMYPTHSLNDHFENDPDLKDTFQAIFDILKGPEYFDDSDSMTDYFHCKHYAYLYVGQHGTPYQQIAGGKPAGKGRQKAAVSQADNVTSCNDGGEVIRAASEGLISMVNGYQVDAPASPEPTPEAEAETPANPFVNSNHAEQQEARKTRLEQRAVKARERGEALHKEAKEMASVIPFGQPILVGHHSEKRDRNYRERIHNKFGKAFEEQEKAERLADRADSAGTGGISTTDPEALEKLQAKLDKLRADQELMKTVNKAIRKKDDQILKDMGLNDEQIAKLKTPDVFGCVGFASYQLSNNNANIKRIEGRIKEIQNLRNSAPIEIKGENGFKVFTAEGYHRIEFDSKPTADVRSVVKSHGFRWSRYNGVWQRKATPQAEYAVNQCANQLKQFENLY